jgi:hypothetical protein
MLESYDDELVIRESGTSCGTLSSFGSGRRYTPTLESVTARTVFVCPVTLSGVSSA